MSNRDQDFVIVGSGVAGMSAALSAAEAGVERIVIAESEREVGGASRFSGGFMVGNGTRQQREAGLEPTADDFYRDYMMLNQWNVDAAPARRFADEAGKSIDWLRDRGVEFDSQIRFAAHEAVPHGHHPVGSGAEVVEKLYAACNRAGVEFVLGQRVDRLLVEDGVVVGVASGEESLTARMTLIATGGFGSDREMLAKWFPDGVVGGDWTFYTAQDGAQGLRGDALKLAEQVGAQITGFNHGLRLLTPGFHRTMDAALPGWLVIVDPDGRRMMNESIHYGVIDATMRRRKLDHAFAIFDDATLRGEGIPASKFDPQGRNAINFNPMWVDQFTAEGRVKKADSVEELAKLVGIPVETLAYTVDRYNGLVAAGADTDFFKEPTYLQPVRQGPFYAVEVRPATVALTAAGMRIDADARVLSNSGAPIPGLLAAGECTGGVVGEFYANSGNSFTAAVSFGRVAGGTAAAELIGAASGGTAAR